MNDPLSEDSPHDLTQENEALLARISKLQQENWVLEEKLAMLELSGGQMAEELVSKTKLIQQYCMESGGKRGANRFTSNVKCYQIPDFLPSDRLHQPQPRTKSKPSSTNWTSLSILTVRRTPSTSKK